MKKLFILSITLLSLALTWCSQINNTTTPKIDNNTDQKILNFLEQTIEKQESCNQWINNEKMFVSYAILWTGINKIWNIKYYLVVSGEWMYLDKRWNISSSCGFGWIPTKIEVQQTQTGLSLIDYQTALDGSLYVSSTKKLFSSEAFKKRQKKDYNYNTNLSPLQKAEKHFWINFWTGWNFECTFCDQKRYSIGYADEKKIKEWIQENFEIFKTNQTGNNYLVFTTNGEFENHGSQDEWTGTRIFWKNDKTILVDTEPHHTYDRYIIQYQTGGEIHLTREILQK